MVEVKLNKSNNNPFYGLRKCLQLLQASPLQVINEQLLNDAWNEVKSIKENREVFFSILFSIGDITNRQHNIFKGKKKDNGGNANRESFYVITDWLWRTNPEQFKKFLNAQLFNEYTCFDVLFRNRVQTKGSKVLKVFSSFKDEKYRKALLEYVYSVINGTNPFNKLLIAKFLTIPRTSKRQGHKKMLPETHQIMAEKKAFLEDLSKMMGWEIPFLKGYRDWRKQYNGDLESVLFSTGKINEFTKDDFISWFDKLPAQARFRVKNRILYSMKPEEVNGGAQNNFKWAKFQPWIKEWEAYKEQKQQEQRILEEKVRQGQANEEDKIKLEKVKKEAKVTTGATNFRELYDNICSGNIDKLKLESFMNKVNLPYNSLVIIDDSGSMSGAPFRFAQFIAAVCLVKNPDDDGRNLIGMFNSYSHWHSYIDSQAYSRNSILRSQVAKTKAQPFVDPTLSFYDNYQRIAAFLSSAFQGGGTNISHIPDGLHKVCQQYPEVLDALKAYPVWTIISDGEWNSLYSPEASINDFFRKCENYFGFRPYIVAMDICDGRWTRPELLKADRFSGIDNMIYIPSNPAMIEMFLTNFEDMDVFDAYTPLLSMSRSNRYELVRQNTL